MIALLAVLVGPAHACSCRPWQCSSGCSACLCSHLRVYTSPFDMFMPALPCSGTRYAVKAADIKCIIGGPGLSLQDLEVRVAR